MMDGDFWENNKEEIQPMFDLVSKGVLARRDSWATKDAALVSLRKQFPYNTWDPRIVQLYVVSTRA